MDKIDQKPLDKLLLDKENPRIYQDISENISQIELAELIYKKFGIKDIKDSLLKYGYFPVEPMVAIADTKEPGKFIILEGNRRLTAIKILCDKKFREKIVSLGLQADYEASPDQIANFDKIPIVIADNRDSVNAYIGVRHLDGIKTWRPLAQARYIFNQIISYKNLAEGRTLKNGIDYVIENTNNKRNTVLNFFYKYAIYRQLSGLIEENTINGDLDERFSLLEVSLGTTGNTSIGKYLGLRTYNQLNPEDYENIIEEDYLNEAKNLIKWLFNGDKSLITDSRKINSHLKPILSVPESRKALEGGTTIEDAFLLTEPYERIIEKACSSIHKDLVRIEKYWTDISPDRAVDLKEKYAFNVLEMVKSVNKTLRID